MNDIAVVIIDPQNDFIDNEVRPGALGVKGAQEDMKRMAAYIEAHMNQITQMVVTLDTHAHYDIGHADYWLDAEGNHPGVFTTIELADLISEKYRPVDPDKKQWVLHYASELEQQGKYKITVWPTHCIEGTWGHEVEPNLKSTLEKWEKSTGLSVEYVRKGMNPDTENYSVFKAEVPIPNDPSTHLNTALIEKLLTHEHVVMGGEAMSHCYKSSVFDYLDYDPVRVTKQLVLLRDCTSSVAGFEAQGEDFINQMSAKNIKIQNAADSIAFVDVNQNTSATRARMK